MPTILKQASVAQLDVCPTDDQEVVGAISLGQATFFRGYRWHGSISCLQFLHVCHVYSSHMYHGYSFHM